MPSYFKKQIYTAYQVLELRFGGATQKAAAVLFLVTRTLASGLRLYLAAVVLGTITDWSLPASILVIGLSTLAYTYFGGIKAVVWIDVLQFAVYLLAAGVALGILLGEVPGGWEEIWRRGSAAHKFRVINWGFDGVAWPGTIWTRRPGGFYGMLTQTYTFWGGLIGGLVLDTATHGADQMMVQRYLTARSEKAAGRALIASGFVILAQFAPVPGDRGRALGALPGPPAGPALDPARRVLPVLHRALHARRRPKGLVIAAVFSVTMSTVSGALSASASSTVNDLYRPLFPGPSERRLLAISKGMTAFWGVRPDGGGPGGRGAERQRGRQRPVGRLVRHRALLGLFLLGLWTKDVGQRSAFLGLVVGTAAVTAVKFLTAVAYPWYALVGSSTVLAVGWLAGRMMPEAARIEERI